MNRKIITIDEEKCNGCGACAQACHEHAIEMIDGKARLVSDEYCDGLGACLPECPTGAITMIERDTAIFNESAAQERMTSMESCQQASAHACPGSIAKTIERGPQKLSQAVPEMEQTSELRQWPVQIHLVNTRASYFQDADLLIAADCTAYAYANFHQDFIRGRVTLIGCPKLDDNVFYAEKFTEILLNNSIRSIMVVRMEVPCCGGIVQAAKRALTESRKIIPYCEIVISTDGRIIPI